MALFALSTKLYMQVGRQNCCHDINLAYTRCRDFDTLYIESKRDSMWHGKK